MKKTALFILFGITLCNACTKAQNETLNWESGKIIIDGNNSDWNSMPRYYSSDMKLFYEMRNDSNNLYILFKAPDRMAQMKLLQAGFEISFKIKTKPKIAASIEFPILPGNSFNMKDMQINNLSPDVSFIKDKFLLLNDPATLNGFEYSNGLIHKENPNEHVISFSINWDDSEALIYELRIPLREFYGNDIRFSEIIQNKINMRVKINALQKPKMPEGIAQREGMPEGGLPDGSMPGGMSGPPPGGMRTHGEGMEMSAFQKQFFEHDFFLALGE